jgi:hypothetical protein
VKEIQLCATQKKDTFAEFKIDILDARNNPSLRWLLLNLHEHKSQHTCLRFGGHDCSKRGLPSNQREL